MNKRNNVIIVDDHPFICAAVRSYIEPHGYVVVDEATNGIDALKKIKKHEPGVVILDIGIPGMDGLALIYHIKQSDISTNILVLSAQESPIFIKRCLEAGADAYLVKTQPLDQLLVALSALRTGHAFYPKVETQLDTLGIEVLSARELLVLKKLCEGLTNKEIANQLLLSEKTISTYRARLKIKLGTNNIVELISIAKHNNIV